jgi:cell division protein FtsI/penicillin-binding protein 2
MTKNWRVNLIFILVIIFSAAILGRLIFLQVLGGDFYKALSQGLHNPFNEIGGERGEIFLNNEKDLAINVNLPLVFAVPKEIKNQKETAKVLSEILNLDENFILEKLENNTSYSLIKRKLSQEEVESLRNLNLKGIFVTEEKERYYPQENLASQVIGFLGAEGKGQYGLEESYDEILQSKEELGGYQKGSDLILTIDYNIQFEAEKLLEKAKENLGIEKGQIIVIEPNSGKVMAMAVFPNFDSNQYEKYAKEGNLEVFKNGATQELFEPGSVFKPIVMAAALEEGKITPQTTYIDEGQVKIGGYTIFNYGNNVWGERSMTEVLEKSINTGAVFAQSQLGETLFLKYIEKFGFFESTGIDLRETYSENQELRKGRKINLATASFGQGITITPIQLAKAYGAIANGGKLVKPYLVERIFEDGKEIQTEPEISQPIISSKTIHQLTAMLVNVVENGFGKGAKVPGYYIAGKTGTAQVAEGGVYSPDKSIQTFAGFFPAFNPKFLILVKLDNPKTRTAEYSAVPIFHDLAEYIIYYYQVPPDYE